MFPGRKIFEGEDRKRKKKKKKKKREEKSLWRDLRKRGIFKCKILKRRKKDESMVESVSQVAAREALSGRKEGGGKLLLPQKEAMLLLDCKNEGKTTTTTTTKPKKPETKK